MNKEKELKLENENLKKSLIQVQPFLINRGINSLLKKLKDKDESVNDTIMRLIKAYVYSFDPVHSHHTPHHIDFNKSLSYHVHLKAGSIKQAKDTFHSNKGYQRWLKTLEQIPKIYRGEI